MQLLDWDDVRMFLAAARAGSFARAASEAGADAATVGRRVSRLEARLKRVLLVRTPEGLTLTAAGSRVLKAAEAAAAALAGAAPEEEEGAGGSVRLSASEGFGSAILAPALPAFRSRRPDILVELAASAGFLSADRREVDLAVTLSPAAGRRVQVEPLTEYELGLFAAPAYLERRGRPQSIEDLERHDLVGYVDDLIYAPELRYLREISPALRPQIASSSIQAQRAILAAGGGVGVLPWFLAEGLEPVLPQAVRLVRRFWVSAHAEVAESARVRAVRRWLRDLVAAEASRLSPGRLAGAAAAFGGT